MNCDSVIGSKKEYYVTDDHLTPWQKENQKYQKMKKEQAKAEKLKARKSQKSTEKISSEIQSETMPDEGENNQHESMLNTLPKIKKEKQMQLLKKLTPLIIFFVIAFPITVFFLSPFSKLGKIEIKGNQNESNAAIVKASKLTLGESILVERKKMSQVETNLQNNFERIKTATVSYSFPNRFVIKIKEKAELAYVQENDRLRVVLADGTILDDKVETQNEDFPVIKSFKSAKQIEKLVIQYQKLSSELRGQIKLIELTPTKANSDFLTLTMADGNQVKITLEDIENKMKYYPEVASQMTEKGIVDMEAGIYSYPYPQS